MNGHGFHTRVITLGECRNGVVINLYNLQLNTHMKMANVKYKATEVHLDTALSLPMICDRLVVFYGYCFIN